MIEALGAGNGGRTRNIHLCRKVPANFGLGHRTEIRISDRQCDANGSKAWHTRANPQHSEDRKRRARLHGVAPVIRGDGCGGWNRTTNPFCRWTDQGRDYGTRPWPPRSLPRGVAPDFDDCSRPCNGPRRARSASDPGPRGPARPCTSRNMAAEAPRRRGDLWLGYGVHRGPCARRFVFSDLAQWTIGPVSRCGARRGSLAVRLRCGGAAVERPLLWFWTLGVARETRNSSTLRVTASLSASSSPPRSPVASAPRNRPSR
jgi:hypothetical protein